MEGRLERVFANGNNTSELEDSQSELNGSLCPKIFYVVASVEIIVCVASVFATSLLFRAQLNVRLWASYERVLSYLLTLSILINSLQTIFEVLAQLINHNLTNDYGLPTRRWANVVGDACSLVKHLMLKILCCTCVDSLEQFYKKRLAKTNGKYLAYRDAFLACLLASIMALLPLSPRGDGGLFQGEIATRIVAYVFLMILLSTTVFNLRKAKKLSLKLEDDFVSRQAQQRLEARIRLRQATNFTRTVFPILQWDIFLSLLTWTVDFAADVWIVPSMKYDDGFDDYIDNLISMLLDIVASTFGLLVPILYLKNSDKIRSAMWPWSKLEKSEWVQDDARTRPVYSIANDLHFKTIAEQWAKKYQAKNN